MDWRDLLISDENNKFYGIFVSIFVENENFLSAGKKVKDLFSKKLPKDDVQIYTFTSSYITSQFKLLNSGKYKKYIFYYIGKCSDKVNTRWPTMTVSEKIFDPEIIIHNSNVINSDIKDKLIIIDNCSERLSKGSWTSGAFSDISCLLNFKGKQIISNCRKNLNYKYSLQESTFFTEALMEASTQSHESISSLMRNVNNIILKNLFSNDLIKMSPGKIIDMTVLDNGGGKRFFSCLGPC